MSMVRRVEDFNEVSTLSDFSHKLSSITYTFLFTLDEWNKKASINFQKDSFRQDV